MRLRAGAGVEYGNRVTGAEIVPNAVYEIAALAEGCDAGVEDYYSAPLVRTTPKWGDVVGSCSVTPCSPPDGSVTITDVVAVQDKFSNKSGSVIKARADLDPNVPDRLVQISDVTQVLDAFCGKPYPAYPHPQDWRPLLDCPPPTSPFECTADIRADIDGDGDIDGFDEFAEDTTTLYLAVNADDDDGSGVSDFEESPVIGEDDLAELQLNAPFCDPPNPAEAWWSISWDDPDPPTFYVWYTPDKSDDHGGPGVTIANGAQNPWPPPTAVWLELPEPDSGQYDIIFTLGGFAAPWLAVAGDPPSTKSDKTRVQVAGCTWRGEDNRYFVVAKKPGSNVSRALAEIDTCEQEPLCPEACNSGIGLGLSGVFVAIQWKEEGDPERLWANLGYARDKLRGGTNLKHGIYAETIVKWCAKITEDCREIRWFDDPDPGAHEYKVMVSQLDGRWRYYLDGNRIHISKHTWPINWAMSAGTEAQWSTELLNVEDRMVGTVNSPCKFRNVTYNENWSGTEKHGLVDSDIDYDPPSPPGPGADEWGKHRTDDRSFEVWDKRPTHLCP